MNFHNLKENKVCGLCNPHFNLFIKPSAYKAGVIKSLSPPGTNSRSAPLAMDFLGRVKSKARSLSANATFMRGLTQNASPLAACGAWAIPAYSGW